MHNFTQLRESTIYELTWRKKYIRTTEANQKDSQ